MKAKYDDSVEVLVDTAVYSTEPPAVLQEDNFIYLNSRFFIAHMLINLELKEKHKAWAEHEGCFTSFLKKYPSLEKFSPFAADSVTNTLNHLYGIDIKATQKFSYHSTQLDDV